MKRRHFILAASVAGASGILGLKPNDAGASYTPYFKALNQELRVHGPYRPALLLDLDQLDKNLQLLNSMIRPGVDYRIVAKSLPSPQLLGHIMASANTHKLMVFHQPFLNHIAEKFPEADVLMGKPMPVKAAEKFYELHKTSAEFQADRQLQWLIDSESRLLQYQQLAQQLNVKMRINIEIDVGLHRGGLENPKQLKAMLETILADPEHLEFSGLMGYDPHVVKLPSILKSPEQAYQESQAIYQGFIDLIRKQFPQITVASLCLNGAGSPTVALHSKGSVINDISAGSCLVKPVDFDINTLAGFKPAAFIASPVLKKMPGTKLPAAEVAKYLLGRWDANMQQTFFIYGGKWLADYESPAGLQGNALFGTSTNQQIVNGSNQIDLDVDDHVFLRPKQSEFVFLQFGDLLTVKGGRLQARWPILKQ